MISIPYIAGLFDGEGHVSITWTARKSGRDPKLCVKLTNTHLPVLLEVKGLYGGCIYANKKVAAHYLQVFVLSLTVEQSKKFLTDMLPHLIIKKRQAEIALLFSSTVYRRGKKRVSEEETLLRESCMKEIEIEKRREWDKGFVQYRQTLKNHVCWEYEENS